MDEEKGMSKEQITNKVQEVAEILLKNAPKNEKILFDKIMRSDDVKLMKAVWQDTRRVSEYVSCKMVYRKLVKSEKAPSNRVKGFFML